MTAVARLNRRCWQIAAILLFASGLAAHAGADEPEPEDAARIRRGVAYLDDRQEQWARFDRSRRGEGANKTACLSCHTGLGYSLARPALRRFEAMPVRSAPERRITAAVGLRVEHWSELDQPQFGLMYDHEERKVVESRGTEAVLDALILARDDAAQARPAPGPATLAALRHLWAAQATEGDAAGSWDWLNFGLEPWEADGSRAFGASLAAIAVGSTPGYLASDLDEPAARGVRSLRDYLRRRFPREDLHNRLWIVEASTCFPGLLSADQRREIVDQLEKARGEDGGWSLAGLGAYRRHDGTPQSRESDGYATALAVRALRGVGTAPTPDRGLEWLRTHQQADGSWRGRSVNKERDPASFVGRFMTDAATAMAALTLAEAEAGSR